MTRRSFKLFTDINEHYDYVTTENVIEIEWQKCIICQTDTTEKTICPANNKNNEGDIVERYKLLIGNIRRFESDLCPTLKRRIEFEQIEGQCYENKAVYHKKCRNRYDDQHFERENNKRRKLCQEASDLFPTSSKKNKIKFPSTNF